jgi:hypothetical protein
MAFSPYGTPVGERRLFGLALGAGLMMACTGTGPSGSGADAALPVKTSERVYRGTLDGRKDLIFFAAHPANLTLAFDPGRCGLYAAWKGPILGDARKTDGTYAPQGPLYHLQTSDTLWRLRDDGKAASPGCRLAGFAVDSSGHLKLDYDLDEPGGSVIHVREAASYDDHYGDIALRREFTVRDLPAGDALSVRVGGQAYAWKEIWSQAADGILDGKPGEETLTMTADGVAEVKLTFEGSAR